MIWYVYFSLHPGQAIVSHTAPEDAFDICMANLQLQYNSLMVGPTYSFGGIQWPLSVVKLWRGPWCREKERDIYIYICHLWPPSPSGSETIGVLTDVCVWLCFGSMVESLQDDLLQHPLHIYIYIYVIWCDMICMLFNLSLHLGQATVFAVSCIWHLHGQFEIAI